MAVGLTAGEGKYLANGEIDIFAFTTSPQQERLIFI